MQFPTDNDSIATLLNLGRYAGARVRADAAVSGLAMLVRTPQEALKEAVAARNDALDLVTDAEAERDFHLDAVHELIIELGRFAHSSFPSHDDEGYARIFPIAPSDIVATPVGKRAEAYAELVERAGHKDTPEAMRPTAKKLAAAHKLLGTAEKKVATAEKAFGKARQAEQKARDAWHTGYRRLHAQLTDKFPRNKGKVDRYFRRPPAAKAKKKRAEETEKAGAGG